MTMTIKMDQAKELVLDVIRARLVPFLQSSPGIGKSSLAREIAEENKLQLIDIRLSQMDPSDLQGLPFKHQDTNKAVYAPMSLFPLRGEDIPEGKAGWLLLLDEFNSSTPAVQAAAYRVVLDRQVGQYDLHPRCLIMAAGNLATDKAIVSRVGTAMQSRLVHFTVDVDAKVWGRWADRSGIDHRVKSFINWKPEALHQFDPNHQDSTFACPRTWDFVSRLVQPYDVLPAEKLPLIAGAFGEGMGREFFGFTKIYSELPDIHAIQRDPEGITLPDEPSVHHALSGLVAYHMTLRNADNLIKFLKRLSIDYQVLSLRSCIARVPEIRQSEAVRGWIKDNSKELM